MIRFQFDGESILKKFFFSLAFATLLTANLSAQDAAKADAPKPAGPAMNVLVEGLDNPSGIAVQPETGVVFVSDSGAARIVKIVDGKIEPVVVEFKTDVYGKGPKYNIGPWDCCSSTRIRWSSVVVTCLTAKNCSMSSI